MHEGPSEKFNQNGLLDRLPDAEVDWLRPALDGTHDRTEELVTWIMDVGETAALVWPAGQGGELVSPPPDHVLDYLVRYEFSGISADVDAELFLHPQAGTVSVVSEFPDCDACALAGVGPAPARYDSRLASRDGRAFLCRECYLVHGTGRLGVGEGHYVMLSEEIPSGVVEALPAAQAFWRARISELS